MAENKKAKEYIEKELLAILKFYGIDEVSGVGLKSVKYYTSKISDFISQVEEKARENERETIIQKVEDLHSQSLRFSYEHHKPCVACTSIASGNLNAYKTVLDILKEQPEAQT